MKCLRCGNLRFTIQEISSCSDCQENAAWNPETEEYTFDHEIIKTEHLNRDHVDSEGECSFGSAHGAGCYVFICDQCGYKTNLPMIKE